MKPKLLFKGPVLTASGYGVHARQILRSLYALDMFDISVKSINWGNTSMILDSTPFYNTVFTLIKKFEAESANNPNYDISVQVTIPNEFEKLARFNVGITAGIEVDRVSVQWIEKANNDVNVLFVPSVHSKLVFENTQYADNTNKLYKLNKHALLAHEGFDQRVFNTDDLEENRFNFEPDFNFLFVGLGISHDIGQERKNISSLIKWFCETFKDNKDVGLILKTAVVNNSLMDFEATKSRISALKKAAGCGEFPRVSLVHGKLSDHEMAQLYKNPKVKCFVSLTHGEGFGLPLLEAAACGLPVMATNWSGHLDFLKMPNDEKSFIELDYELTEIPESAVWSGVLEKGSQWASVKEDDVKLKLRKVYSSYEKPKEWALNLAGYVKENFTESKVMFKLATDIVRAYEQFKFDNPSNVLDAAASVKKKLNIGDEKTLLYTMPMSAGDVYISTAVVNSLKKKFPDYKIFFATKENYKSILNGNNDIDQVIDWQEWMMNIPLLEKIFTEVYTPNMNIQMTFSNWVHGGKGRKLANEMANSCFVNLGNYFIKPEETTDVLPEKYIVFNPGSGKGQWEARNYRHWQEVINNLSRELNNRGIEIVQVGLEEDPHYDNCIDFRGKTTNYNQLAYVIEKSSLVLSIDSVTMHMAAGLGVDHVALFGSSYANSTGPVVPLKLCKDSAVETCKSILLETPSRYTCDKACYQYTCNVDKDFPCINEIPAWLIYDQVLCAISNISYSLDAVEEERQSWKKSYEEYRPRISGYTHVYNAESGEYPFVESILSMVGFCDEVIVVDGGSTDRTVEKIKALGIDKIQVLEHKWDWDEPGMDGMQKAYGRAMCSGDFLWQQDVDEIVHEEDYEKIKNLVKRFPTNVDILHLPVIELWGDNNTVRTDRHSWKWRLSRNNFRITHGINKNARVIDEKNGKIYSKKGMSDGCEYVDIMTHEFMPHAGFYNGQLEDLRVNNPKEYGKIMNEVFEKLPSVFHYSWENIPRKIKNFKQFWNKCWSNLYNEESPTDRFPMINGPDDNEKILEVAAELKNRGGEHGPALTFKLNRSNPKMMVK